MGILDALKKETLEVENKVEEAVNPQPPTAPELPKEPEALVEVPKEEVLEPQSEEVASNATEVAVNKCPDCVDGLVGDPTGVNNVCTNCNGTGVVI